MLEVVCATICAGVSACASGVVNGVPTPAAVAPMITTCPAYLVAGIWPESTS